MATVYFGSPNPPAGYSANNRWSDINQWFADQGSSGEGYYYPAVPLGRFPDPATDLVFLYQDVGFELGTWIGGTYPTGSYSTGTYAGPVDAWYRTLYDPSATWSGIITGYPNIYRGTFTGNLRGLSSTRISGGTFTNTVSFSTSSDWSFSEGTVSGTTPYTLTLPTGFSITTNNSVQVVRSMTVDFPITCSQLSVYRGNLTNQHPVFTRDMSTTATGIRSYSIIGSPRLNSDPKVPTDLSTIFVNTATLTFGTPTQPAGFEFYDVQITRPTIIYTGGNTYSGRFASNFYGQASIIIVYTQLTLLTSQGFTRGNVFPQGDARFTYVTSGTVAILSTLTAQGTTKYTLDPALLPQPFGFGKYVSEFQATINLALTKNIQAVME